MVYPYSGILCICKIECIHSFFQYLLSVYYVPGSVVSTRNNDTLYALLQKDL